MRKLKRSTVVKILPLLMIITLSLAIVSQVIVLCNSLKQQKQTTKGEFIDNIENSNNSSSNNNNENNDNQNDQKRAKEQEANFGPASFPSAGEELPITSEREQQKNDRSFLGQRVRRHQPEVASQQEEDNKSPTARFDELADVEVAAGGRSCYNGGSDELEPLDEEQQRIESLLARYFRVESNYPSRSLPAATVTRRFSKGYNSTGDRGVSDSRASGASGDVNGLNSGRGGDQLPQLPRPTNVTVLIVSWYPPILNLSWTLNELNERQVSRLDFYRPQNTTSSSSTPTSGASLTQENSAVSDEATLQEYDLSAALEGSSIARGDASGGVLGQNQHNINHQVGYKNASDSLGVQEKGGGSSSSDSKLDERQSIIRELKRQRFLVRKSLTCFQVTYNIVNSRFKVTEEYPPDLRSIQIERILPATEYSLRVVAIYLAKYKLASERVHFISPTDNESRRFKENSYRPIHYYPDERTEPKVGLAHVRSEELTIVAIAVMFWIATICLFFNKWGKIRMLEPYQPAYRDTSGAAAAASAAAAVNFAHHHPSLHNLHGSSGATGSLTALGAVGVGGVTGTGANTGTSSLVGLSLVAGGGGGAAAKGLSSSQLMSAALINEAVVCGSQQAPPTTNTKTSLLDSQRLSGSGSLTGSVAGRGGVGTSPGSLPSAGVVPVAPNQAASIPTQQEVRLGQRQSEGQLVCRKQPPATSTSTAPSGYTKNTANLLRLGNKRFETMATDEFPIRTTRVLGAEDELSFRFHAKALALARATSMWTKQQQEKQKQMRQHQQQQQQQFRARLTSSLLSGSNAISALAAFRSAASAAVTGDGKAKLEHQQLSEQQKIPAAGISISSPPTAGTSQDSNSQQQSQQQKQHPTQHQRQYGSSPNSIGSTPVSLSLVKSGAMPPSSHQGHNHPPFGGLRALKTVSLETRHLQPTLHSTETTKGKQLGQPIRSLGNSAGSCDSLALGSAKEQQGDNLAAPLQHTNQLELQHHNSDSAKRQMQLSAQSSLTSCGSSWAQLLRQETMRQQSRAFDFGQELPSNTGSPISRSFERQRSDSRSMCAISGGQATDCPAEGAAHFAPRPHSAAGLRRSLRTPSATLAVEGRTELGSGGQRMMSPISGVSPVVPESSTTIIMTGASGSQTSSCGGSGTTAGTVTSGNNNNNNSGSANKLRRLQFVNKLHQHHHMAQSHSTSTLIHATQTMTSLTENNQSDLIDQRSGNVGENSVDFNRIPGSDQNRNQSPTGRSHSRSLDHQDAATAAISTGGSVAVSEQLLTLRRFAGSQKMGTSQENRSEGMIQIGDVKTETTSGGQRNMSDKIGASKQQLARSFVPTIQLPPKPSNIDLGDTRPMEHHILIEPPSPPNRLQSPMGGPIGHTMAGSRSYDYSTSLSSEVDSKQTQGAERDSSERAPTYGRLRNEATRSSWSVGQQSYCSATPLGYQQQFHHQQTATAHGGRRDDAFVKLAEYQRDLSLQRQQRQQRGQSLVASMMVNRQIAGCCCLRIQQAQAHLAQCSFCSTGSGATAGVLASSQVCACHSEASQDLPAGPSINLLEHQDPMRQHFNEHYRRCRSSTSVRHQDTSLHDHTDHLRQPHTGDMLLSADIADQEDGQQPGNCSNNNYLRPRISSVFVTSPYTRGHRDSFAMLHALSQKKSKSAEDVAYLSSLVLQIWARDRNPLLQSVSQQQLSNASSTTPAAGHHQRRQSHQAQLDRRRHHQQRPRPKSSLTVAQI